MEQIGVCGGANGFAPRWAEALRRRGAEMRELDLLGADPLGQVAGCDGVI